MAAAVVHLSVHGRLRRSPEIVSQTCYRPSLLRCRAFKQETGGDDEKPSSPPPKRRKGPLYKLKAVLQGLAGSKSAAAEVYGGQYERAVEKAEEIFFSVSSVRQPSILPLDYMANYINGSVLYCLLTCNTTLCIGRYQLSRMRARIVHPESDSSYVS
jgi:hypothetical protein